MPDPISVPADLVGKAAAAIIAAPIAALVTWLTQRKLQKANIQTMIVDAAGGLVDRLEKECKRVTAECSATRSELSGLRQQHRSCEARLDDLEREKQALKSRIDALMDGRFSAPIPPYGNDDVRRADAVGRAAQERQAKKGGPDASDS